MIILSPSKVAEEANPLYSSQYPFGRIAGWGMAGVTARCLSLGMQLKPLTHRPHRHLLWFSLWGACGYYAWRLEKRLFDKMENERDKLVKRRMLRLEREEQS